MRIQDMLRATYTHRWSIVNTSRTQTVAEHSWAVAVIAEELAIRAGVTEVLLNEVRNHAIYHDVAEAVTGDIPTPTKRRLNGAIRSLEHDIYPPTVISEWSKKIVKYADNIEAYAFILENGVGRHAKKIEDRLKVEMNIALDNEKDLRLRQAVTSVIYDVTKGEVLL